MISTLLVTDDADIAEKVTAALAGSAFTRLSGPVVSIDEAIARIEKDQPAVVLLTPSIEAQSSNELIRYTRTVCPQSRILLLTRLDELMGVTLAVAAGISAYCLVTGLASLDEEIQRLVQDTLPLSPMLARQLIAVLSTGTDNPLTAKEQEVLGLIAKGMSYDEVADAASVSINTVRTHLRKIYEKLHVHSKNEAVFEASNSGWLLTRGSAAYLLQNILAADDAETQVTLTEREHEVLALLAKGLTYAGAAEVMSASINTVRTHVRSILGKFDVHSMSEAVFEARRMGIAHI